MSFMEPEIFEDSYFEVETVNGTEFVPCSVCGLQGITEICNLADYLEFESLNNEAVASQPGWVCRLSAPGYIDCTAWAAFKTEQECKDYLDEMYGEDE